MLRRTGTPYEHRCVRQPFSFGRRSSRHHRLRSADSPRWCPLAQATLDVSSTTEIDPDAPLYRHVKRPEWGVAILAWERDETRGYQFEDGSLRKIRKGYYKLLEPADDLGDRAEHIRENLRRVVNAGEDDSDRKVIEAACPFSAQVDLFTRLYPKGFQDPEWIEDHRTTDGSPLKRHRTPVAAEVREALSPERCEEAIAADRHLDLSEVVADLLARTDLVPISHAKALRGLEPQEKRTHVEAVVDLLHGDRPYDARFRDYLQVLADLFGERPSWRVATVLSGLYFPQEHTVVRRSAFIRQAGSIAPTARYTRRARVRSYRSFRRVAVGTRERLAAAGHEPHDLMDVYDFIWTTLRTSALEHIGGES